MSGEIWSEKLLFREVVVGSPESALSPIEVLRATDSKRAIDADFR